MWRGHSTCVVWATNSVSMQIRPQGVLGGMKRVPRTVTFCVLKVAIGRVKHSNSNNDIRFINEDNRSEAAKRFIHD